MIASPTLFLQSLSGLIKADRGVNTDLSEQKTVLSQPFVFDAFVSLTSESADKRPIHALRDTACSQSVILASALPFYDHSACHYSSVHSGDTENDKEESFVLPTQD